MPGWRDVYYGDLQSLWAPLVVPFAFLVYRAFAHRADETGREARFVAAYSVVWAIETMLDPIVGGPVSRALGWSGGLTGTIVMFGFVLLGDLRVFLLFFGLAAPNGWPRAVALALVVPVATGVLYGTASWANPDLPSQTMWLIYELGFVTMTIWLARVWVREHVPPERPGLAAMLRSCAGYVAAYYVLWATCDVLILIGLDEGWALRMVPNQLYYALWVPFVYVRYFAARAP
jgi:hypothetical protein